MLKDYLGLECIKLQGRDGKEKEGEIKLKEVI